MPSHKGIMTRCALGLALFRIGLMLVSAKLVRQASEPSLRMEHGKLFVQQIERLRKLVLGSSYKMYSQWLYNEPVLGILHALPMAEHVGSHEIVFENENQSVKLRIIVYQLGNSTSLCKTEQRPVVYILFPQHILNETFSVLSTTLLRLQRLFPVAFVEIFHRTSYENTARVENSVRNSGMIKFSLTCLRTFGFALFETLVKSLMRSERFYKFGIVRIAYGFEQHPSLRTRRSITASAVFSNFTENCSDLSNCLKTILVDTEANTPVRPSKVADSQTLLVTNNCLNSANPSPKLALLQLNVTLNKAFHLEVNQTLFKSIENSDLQLNFTWFDGSALSVHDFIQFSNSLGMIYGWMSLFHLKQQPEDGFLFRLTATDNCMKEGSINVTVLATDQEPERCIEFELVAISHLEPSTPCVNIAVALLSTLMILYNDSHADHHILVYFGKVEPLSNTFSVRFADTSASCQPCDFRSYRQKLRLALDLQGRLQATFLDLFKPDFAVLAFTSNTSLCSSNMPPVVSNPIPHLYVNDHGRAIYEMDSNTFWDDEDGSTVGLHLQIRTIGNQNAIIAILKDLSIEIFQVAITDTRSVQFVMTATDSQGKSVDASVTVIPRQEPILAFGCFEFEFSTFFAPPAQLSTVFEYLINTIAIATGDETWSKIFSVSYDFSGYYPQQVRLIWSNTTFSSASSDSYFLVRDQLFDHNLNLKDDIRNRFFPKVTVTLSRPVQYNASRIQIFPTSVSNIGFLSSVITAPQMGTLSSRGETTTTVALPPLTERVHVISVIPSPTVASTSNPFVTKVLEPVNTSFCETFEYVIPDDLFFDPVDGTTRNLSLKILKDDGADIANDSWISMHHDIQVIFGLVKFSDYMRRYPDEFVYQIQATNSRNRSVTAPFIVRLPSTVPRIYLSINLTVNSFYSAQTPDIRELLLLTRKVAKYFGESSYSWVNVLSFDRSDEENYVSFAWTNCSISSETQCPRDTILELRESLLLGDTIANPKFASYLSPQYVIYNVSGDTDTKCSVAVTSSNVFGSSRIASFPIGKALLEVCHVTAGRVFMCKIPQDAFYYAKDDYKPFLALQLSNSDGSYLSKSSWIQFNQASQQVYGILYVDSFKNFSQALYNYTITATNSGGESMTSTFYLQGYADSPNTTNIEVMLIGSQYFSSGMNDIQVVMVLLERIANYMDFGNGSLEVLSFGKEAWPTGSFSVNLAMYVALPEDDSKVSDVVAKLVNKDGSVNQFLNLALMPEAVVKSAEVSQARNARHWIGSLSPNLSVLIAPRILNPIPQLFARVSSIFRYRIRDNTFFDEIDGFTKNLDFRLLSAVSEELPLDSWIILLEVSMELTGVLTKSNLAGRRNATFEFILRATNSKGYSTDLKIEIVGLDDMPFEGTLVTMTGSDVFPSSDFNLPVLVYILGNLYRYFVPMPPEDIYAVAFRRIAGVENKFVLKWGASKLSNANCTSDDLTMFTGNLVNDDGKVEHNLQLALSPSVTVTSILVHVNCTSSSSLTVIPTPSVRPNTPPVVMKFLPTLAVDFCKSFFYLIPSDTFFDAEDGDSRNLKLKLYDLHGALVETTSWIQLNERLQILYGILKYDDYASQLALGHIYMLEATDSKMASVKTKVTFVLPDRQFNLYYVAHLHLQRFIDTTETDINEQFILITKITNFISDSRFMTLQPISFSREKTSETLKYSWTYCLSNTHEVCPYLQLLNASKILFTEEKKVKESFRLSLLPQYAVISGFDEFTGSCSSSLIEPSPATHKSTGYWMTQTSSEIINNPPIVYSKINILRPSLYKAFQFRIPEDSFFDVEDGYAAALKITLTNSDGKELGPSSWLYLDEQRQTILGILRDDILSQTVTLEYYRLTATDKGGLSTYQVIAIILPRLEPSSAYQFLMKFSWARKSSSAHLLAELYTQITNFISEEYIPRLMLYKEEQLTLKWSEYKPFDVACNPRYISRVTSNFISKEGYVSQTFAEHVSSFITIHSLSLQVDHLCQYNSTRAAVILSSSLKPTLTALANFPPIVLRVIPALTISPCYPLSYKLPEDTFFDVEDGLTRNLKLHLLNSQVRELGPEAWIHLNSSRLLITGIISTEFAKTTQYVLFQLVARDKDGLSASFSFNIVVQRDMDEAVHVEFTVKGTQAFPKPSFMLIGKFMLEKMQEYLFMETNEKVSLRLARFSGELIPWITVTYSLCSTTCLQTKQLLSGKLRTTSDALPSSLAAQFLPLVQIMTFEIERMDNCFPTELLSTSFITRTIVAPTPTPSLINTAPYFLLELPKFYISTCSMFTYAVPERTCFDNEDGLTRNLRVSLAFLNGTSVGNNYWLFLNTSTLHLQAVLSLSDLPLIRKQMKFVIRCQDSQGLSASQTITFIVNYNAQEPSHVITVKSYTYFEWPKSDVEMLFAWISKVTRYFRDRSSTYIQIVSFEHTQVNYPQLIVSWYNCSIEDPCAKNIAEMKSRIFAFDSLLSPRFTRAMFPEFVLISSKYSQSKECPIFSMATLSPGTLFLNRPPVVVRPKLVIEISLCKFFTFQIPSDTFRDEDGDAHQLHLNLLDNSGSLLTKSSWFNMKHAELIIYGCASFENFKNRKHVAYLQATDAHGLSSRILIEIFSKDNFSDPLHYFSAGVIIKESFDNLPDMIISLSLRINGYFHDANAGSLSFRSYTLQESLLKFEWSNCTLASACNTNEVAELRSKLVYQTSSITSTIVPDFASYLAPEFVITSLHLVQAEICTEYQDFTPKPVSRPFPLKDIILPIRPLIKNTAPRVNNVLADYHVPLCSSFSFRIPETTFSDVEDGNTRHLQLSLLSSKQEALQHGSWIALVASTQVVFGQLFIEVLQANEMRMDYVLRAHDKDGLYVDATLTLVIPPKPQIGFLFSIAFGSLSASINESLRTQLFLVSKIASYSGDPDISMVAVYSFVRNETWAEIKWTNCSYFSEKCSTHIVDKYREMFVSDDGATNPDFALVFQPFYRIRDTKITHLHPCSATSFHTKSMNAVQTTSLLSSFSSYLQASPTANVDNPPRLVRFIPPISVKRCESFSYYVQEDLFVDEDGTISALTVTLRDELGYAMPKSSWIWFNSNFNVIYGFIKEQDILNKPRDGYYFALTARDSKNQETSAKLQILTPEVQSNYNFRVSLILRKKFQSNAPLLNYLNILSSTLVQFFRNSSLLVVQPIHFYESESSLIHFEWTNCSSADMTCRDMKVLNIKTMMMDENGMTRHEFTEIFLPQFELKDVEVDITTDCLQRTTTLLPIPTPSIPGRPVLYKSLPPVEVNACSTMVFTVPWDTFFDAEDGFTRTLTLRARLLNGSEIPKTFWIQFSSVMQTFRGIVSRTQASVQPPNGYTLLLIAEDSESYTVSTLLTFLITQQYSPPRQNITMHLFENSYSGKQVSDLSAFVSARTALYFANTDTRFVDILSVKSLSLGEPVYEVTWSNCSNSALSCDLVKQRILRDDGLWKPAFAQCFLPEFTLTWLTIDTDDTCSARYGFSSSLSYPSLLPTPTPVLTTSPKANYNLSFHVNYCGGFYYEIREDMFTDAQGRGTSTFDIELLFKDGSPVLCDSWLLLDTNKKILYGMPTHSERNSPSVFLIRGEDSNRAKAIAYVSFVFDKPLSDLTYKISLSFKSSYTSSTCSSRLLLILKTKFEDYFGQVFRNVTFIFFARGDRGMKSYVMWTSCAIRSRPCDFVTIRKIRQKLFDNAESDINPNLGQALGPEFNSLSVAEEMLGECTNNEPPVLRKKLSPASLKQCGLFNHEIPVGTFYDPEDGDTRQLKIEAFNEDGSNITPDSWFQLDTTSQAVYGMPTAALFMRNVSRIYKVLVKATDVEGAYVFDLLQLNLTGGSSRINQSITMEFKCLQSSHSLVAIVIRLLNHIALRILRVSVNQFLLINFHGSNRKVNITWSVCEFLLMNAAVRNYNFSDFRGTECKLSNWDISDNRDLPPRPSIQNLYFSVSHCEQVRHRLHNDVFLDKESGDIRSLQLRITNVDGSQIPPLFWITYDPKTYDILISPNHLAGRRNHFLLVATDDENQAANISIYVSLTDLPPNINFIVIVQFWPYINATALSSIFDFIKLLKLYLSTSSGVFLFDTRINIKEKSIEFGYGNCSLRYDPCDYEALSNISSLLWSGNSTNIGLFKFMYPKFEVKQVMSQRSGPCLVPHNDAPIVAKSINLLELPSCKILQYVIPTDTFYDKQDGWTRNLTLKLLHSRNKEIEDSCWIDLDPSTQVIRATASQDSLIIAVDGWIEIYLQASDSLGAAVNTSLRFKVPPQREFSFEIVMLVEILAEEYHSCMSHKLMIMEKLQHLYNDTVDIGVKSLVKSTNNMYAEIVFVNCWMSYSPCNYIALDHMTQKVQSRQKHISPIFSLIMRPEYEAKYVTTKVYSPCEDNHNTAPRQASLLELPQVRVCLQLSYKLPRNLFIDLEDGDFYALRSLLINSTIELEVLPTSWVYINDQTKEIHIAPTTMMVDTYEQRSHNFKIVAIDSRYAKAAASFTLNFTSWRRTSTFEVEINVTSTIAFQSAAELLVRLSRQLRQAFEMPQESLKVDRYYLAPRNKLSNIVVVWSTCSSTDICDYQTLSKVTYTLKSNELRNILGSQFVVHGLRLITYPLCQEPPNRPPKPLYAILNFTMNPCAEVKLQIPEDAFIDDRDGYTRNLSLRIFPIGASLNLSSMVFNNASQILQGFIPLALFKVTEFIEYAVVATDSSNERGNFTLRIYRRAYVDLFDIFIGAITHVGRSTTDAKLLRQLIFTMQDYLKLGNESLSLVSFENIKHDPPRANFTVAVCLEEIPPCNFTEVHRILTALQHDDKPRISFVSFMLPRIIPDFIGYKLSGFCADSPPRVKENDTVLAVSFCKALEYEIPEDAFLDFEDGGTLNLSLQLLPFDSQTLSLPKWIEFDKIRGVIRVVPTIDTLKDSFPALRLRLVAEDRSKNSAYQVLRLIWLDSVDDINYILNVTITSSRNNICDTQLRILLTRKLQEAHNWTKSEISVLSLVRWPMINSTMTALVYDCGLSKQQCSIYSNDTLASSFVLKRTETVVAMNRALQPDFLLLDVTGVKLNACKNMSDAPILLKEIPVLNLSLCSKIQYKIPSDSFYDFVDGDLSMLSAQLLSKDAQPLPHDDFLQFEGATKTIVGYAMQTDGAGLNQTNYYYYYILRVFDRDGNYIDTIITVHLRADPLDNSFVVEFLLESFLPLPMSRTHLAFLLSNKIGDHFRDFEANYVSIINMTSTQGLNATVRVLWTNCTFQKGMCRFRQLYVMHSKLFARYTEPNPYLINSMYREFRLLKVYSARFGACRDELNFPPEARENLTLQLPACGLFIYRIPSTAFYDYEDGSTRNLSLQLTSNGTTPLAYDTWIALNPVRQELYGIAVSFDVQKFDLKLTATDSGNKTAATQVTVKFHEQKQVRTKLTVVLSCERRYDQVYLLPVIMRLVKLISPISNVRKNDLTLVSVLMSNKTITLNFTRCNSEVLEFTELIGERVDDCHLTSVKVPDNHKMTSVSYYVSRPSTTTPNASIHVVSTPISPQNFDSVPISLNSIGTVSVPCGVPFIFKIPQATFYDREDGLTRNLTLTIVDLSDDRKIPPWMIFDKTEQIMYILLSTESCIALDSQRIFSLRASDSFGNYVLDTFRLTRAAERPPSCCYSVHVSFLLPYAEVVSDVLLQHRLYKAVSYYLGDDQSIRILAIISGPVVHSTTVIFSNVSMANESCTMANVALLSKKFFSLNGIVKKSFAALLLEFGFLDAKEIINSNCNSTTAPGALEFTTSAPTLEAYTSSEDWLIYLIPLFVLAGGLLFIAIGFFLVRACWARCCAVRFTSDRLDKNVYVSEREYAAAPENGESVSGLAQLHDNTNETPLDAQIFPATLAAGREVRNDLSLSSLPVAFENPGNKARGWEPYDVTLPQAHKEISNDLRSADSIYVEKSAKVRKPRKRLLSEQSSPPRRLPAVPPGPPPPYSPPRRNRLFVDNMLPAYYERYTKSDVQRCRSPPIMIPVRAAVPVEFTANNPVRVSSQNLPGHKKLKKALLKESLRRLHKASAKRKPIVQIPLSEISTMSESSVLDMSSSALTESSGIPITIQGDVKASKKTLSKLLVDAPVSIVRSKKKDRRKRLSKSKIYELKLIERPSRSGYTDSDPYVMHRITNQVSIPDLTRSQRGQAPRSDYLLQYRTSMRDPLTYEQSLSALPHVTISSNENRIESAKGQDRSSAYSVLPRGPKVTKYAKYAKYAKKLTRNNKQKELVEATPPASEAISRSLADSWMHENNLAETKEDTKRSRYNTLRRRLP